VEKITKTIQVKRPLTPEAKDNLLKEMSSSKKEVEELELMLADLKEKEKEKKEQISAQQSNILSLIGQYEVGYTIENSECLVSYEGNVVKYTDVNTGKIVDEHKLSNEEQLQLSEHRIDAEDIIRADNENQDS
jgi:hypothetical protein